MKKGEAAKSSAISEKEAEGKGGLIRQFILYTIIGLSSTAVQYAAYLAVLWAADNYYIANAAGFFLSVLNSFTWNQRFVFQCGPDEERVWWKALMKTYMMYSGTGIVLTSILLHVFIEVLSVSRYAAPIVIVVLIYPLNFLISKLWAYRTEKKDETH